MTALSILRSLRTQSVVSQGDIVFQGQSLLHASEPELRRIRGDRIAMIFQEPMVSLNPLHNIEKQLAEVLSLHRGMRRDAARKEIIQTLTAWVLPKPPRLGDFPHQLSGGERQRVMIAMAILIQPRLLIADEPTTALDVSVQAQILALLHELKQELGMAMLFITHNLRIVRSIADNVAVMKSGRLVSTALARRCLTHRSTPIRDSCCRPSPRVAQNRSRLTARCCCELKASASVSRSAVACCAERSVPRWPYRISALSCAGEKASD